MKFYLCRHGQTHWNAARILLGQYQSEVTESGIEQAKQLAHSALSWGIDLVVSSHLLRAKQTAEICAKLLDTDHLIEAGFAERNFAEWQGREIAKIEGFKAFRQQCYSDVEHRPNSNAENTQEVRHRFLLALNTLAKAYPNSNAILVVSHGDAMDCAISNWTNPQYLKNGEFVVLDYYDGELHIDQLPEKTLQTQSV